MCRQVVLELCFKGLDGMIVFIVVNTYITMPNPAISFRRKSYISLHKHPHNIEIICLPIHMIKGIIQNMLTLL